VRGTFFCDARRAIDHPGVLRAVAEAGHEVALHCVEHVRHSERSRAEVLQEAREGSRILRSLGHPPRCWRTPWGVLGDATLEAAQQEGLELWGWSADTHDWRGDSAEAMLARLRGELGSGDIVLMHDALGPGAMREGCAETVRLIEPLADLARQAGLEPGPISVRAAAPC